MGTSAYIVAALLCLFAASISSGLRTTIGIERDCVMSDPAVYGGSWYAASMTPAPERAPLTVETDVDVCVIGGGLAGLTAAREAARRGWSVVLLEAQRIAWNASGRNLGFVLPGFAADYEKI